MPNLQPTLLFAYGSLRQGREAGNLFDDAVLERRTARAKGELRRGRRPFPIAKFDSASELFVPGELVSLDPAFAGEALARIANYEGFEFRETRICVFPERGDPVEAVAFEWVGGLDDWNEYLVAASNKLDVTRYHIDRLRRITPDDESARIPIQAHIEGILYAGAAAADQIAEALNLLLHLEISNVTPERLFESVGGAQCDVTGLRRCVEHFEAWARRRLVRNARELRRRATHHYYDKTHSGERGWFLEEVEIRGAAEPYRGRRDVHSYCEAFARELDALQAMIDCIRMAVSSSRGFRGGNKA